MIAMDAASSEWKSEKGKGFYKQPKSGKEFTSDELIADKDRCSQQKRESCKVQSAFKDRRAVRCFGSIS